MFLSRSRGRCRRHWLGARTLVVLGAAAIDGTAGGRAVDAQTVPQHHPTLEELIARALEQNPDILTARLRADSAQGERRIARSIPNPTYSVVPGSPTQYSLSQLIDVGPARLFRTRAAARGLEATGYDVRDVTRQVTFNVQQGYFDLLLAESLRSVAVAQRDIFRRLLASDSVRFRSGDLPRRDVAATELQASRADAALARASATARAARIALQVLVGVTRPDTAFRVAGTLDYRPVELPLDSLQTLAFARRPDIAASRLRLQQSEAIRSMARADIVPVPAVTGVYQKDPFPSGSNYALGFGFNLPLFYWFGGERERAAAGLRAAMIAERRTEVQVQSDIALAADNYRASRELAERYTNGLLERSRQAVEMQRFAYEQGAASLLDMLTSMSAFNDIQTDYYTALHDYWVSVYAINSAAGGGLAR